MAGRGGTGGPDADGPGADVDLDGGGPAPDQTPRARPSRRRRWASAAVAAAVAVAALAAVQHARADQRDAEAALVGLVGVGGDLVQVSRPTSADNNTRATLTVDLRNDTAVPVTLVALRPAADAGSLMRDDLRSSGAESMGVETGATLRPGRRVTVALSGVVRCPGGGGPAVTGDLSASVRDPGGPVREVVVPGPADRSWTTALERACAAGPAR